MKNINTILAIKYIRVVKLSKGEKTPHEVLWRDTYHKEVIFIFRKIIWFRKD